MYACTAKCSIFLSPPIKEIHFSVSKFKIHFMH